MIENKFHCPACGTQIFNRRFSKCEGCGMDLPHELLLTKEEIAELDREQEKVRAKERKSEPPLNQEFDFASSLLLDGVISSGSGSDGSSCS